MHNFKIGTNHLQIRTLSEGIFRIRQSPSEKFSESLLERYHILHEPEEDFEGITDETKSGHIIAGEYSVLPDLEKRTLRFSGKEQELFLQLPVLLSGEKGFHLEIDLDEDEALYGLGDVERERLNRRGGCFSVWQANVTTYGPIPYLMSSRGWGILINCTYRQQFDLGSSKPNRILIDAENGGLDFYVFLADNMQKTLELYTLISGRSVMLPRAAYGITSVCSEDYDAQDMLTACMQYRKFDIPCDIIGLEPEWMEKFYDFTVDKKWDPKRFYLPTWLPENTSSEATFFYNLRKMGYKLSLWLCCDYDLLWEEEHSTLYEGYAKRNSFDGAAIVDAHFEYDALMDKYTKQGEPWFEHLKKFVDNGAAAFKLDGANQVLEHPDRLWAGKYTDDEVHNVYPVIYAKQMKEGFENYTGRRAMIYTPSLYAGTQQYAATWAGDTGGGHGSLVSILNLALCGHSNASCDMDPTTPEGMHCGFLMPWTQYNGWRNWQLPWFMGEETENMWRRYAHLRSSLFPYIYSMAHKAAETGLPMARPMCLVYPGKKELADAKNIYMLGDSMLVGAFDMNICLPDGEWMDMFTGKIYGGGKSFAYEIPEGWGGALFAKSGSVWVTQKSKPYLDSPKPAEYTIHIYPGEDCGFTMYEDDGISYGYLKGEVAKTDMLLKHGNDNSFCFILKKRQGGYDLNKNEEYNIIEMSENHPSNRQPLPDVSAFHVVIYLSEKPNRVFLQEKEIDAIYQNGRLEFDISKEMHERGDCPVNVKMN